ncbi:/ plsY / G3P acyltransferase /:332132 Reverse [Candidatus Hepatoplasma crinochetorum]|uniref:Glycerol-3-phosphate acyltransferase n=1 Tax=Candidatus Hepatoplasma crinochetorum TaxID=295596 RepID=A0A0G7ZN03_9MOLU|nr:/ plsY / G3P acyltransferase /:332132 Reverse [Candidatus Hepatoplasma crinochetorum]
MDIFLGLLLYSTIAYLVGSMNAGQLISRYKKVDLGKIGSKNYGATNAGRTFGKGAFILVFLFDFLKAFLVAIVFTELSANLNYNGDDNIFNAVEDYIAIAVFFVVIGHVWPIWFKFKGGKGVATTFGFMLAINWIFCGIGGIVFLILFFSTKHKVTIASLGAVFSIAFLGTFNPYLSDGWPLFIWSQTTTAVVILWFSFILIVYRHRGNLILLYNEYKKHKIDKENQKATKK